MPTFLFARAAIVTLAVVGLPASDLQAQNGTESVARRAAAQNVKPGDRIEFQFLRDRELSGAVNVNERGEAVFPKLGTIHVSRFTIGALQDTMVSRYREYLRDAELQISVLRRVVVNGEVRSPDVYYLDVSSGVRDAIAKAGGPLETGRKSRVTIVRDSRQFRAKDWERNQGPENDLQSGDQILVPRQPWLVLNALPVISTSVIVIGLISSLRR
jgi:protein involved in polysaccharide export with SLBB domain